eukprot:TRINITY_DN4417_c0_g1_i2.p1 TRINITY_DN4417_c0_g1~~TRINITY_DN4417_c0_g1_i2.p1  ORF type:complete len:440 (-),score=25.09 TRINITY_DN4417_c0_g1_i2:30-1256(-)
MRAGLIVCREVTHDAKWLWGMSGQSCDQVCSSHDLTCVQSPMHHVTATNFASFNAASLPTSKRCSSTKTQVNALNPMRWYQSACYGNSGNSDCTSSHTRAERLCYCSEFPSGSECQTDVDCPCAGPAGCAICRTNLDAYLSKKTTGECTWPPSSFTITLVDTSGGYLDKQPTLKRYFKEAAEKWSSVIRGHNLAQGRDVHLTIEYSFVDIDGAYGVLGAAGPTEADKFRDEGSGKSRYLPTKGVMKFDKGDIKSGHNWKAVILHEMGHVLGIGSLWTVGNIMVNCDKGYYTPVFDDAASRAYVGLGGQLAWGFTEDTVPEIERDGGGGTACVHWDNQAFQNELMTGYIAKTSPLSIITIGGLEDLGYAVDYRHADTYKVPRRVSRLAAPPPKTRAYDYEIVRPPLKLR